MTSLVSPILIEDEFKGIIGIDITLPFLQEFVENKNKELYNGSGTISVISNIGIISAHSGNPELLGKKMDTANLPIDNVLEKIKNGVSTTYINRDSESSIVIEPIKIGYTNTPWSIIVEVPNEVVFSEVELLNENLNKRIRSDTLFQIILSLGILLIVVIIMIIIIRRIISPIKKATKLAESTSKGILNKDEIITNSKDEVGKLILSMNEMVKFYNDRNELMSSIGNGNLDVEVKLASNEDEVGIVLDNMVKSLYNIVVQINNSVSQVSQGADQIATSSQTLSQGSSEQASTLEEISASINEIGSQVQANSESAINVSELSIKAKDNAEKGAIQMNDLVKAMEDISKSANDIKNIVKVIDDIAFQTNLLALNADIEAARVGKYGKGFAVVANSVRNLAAKSANSVKETTDKVVNAIKNIERGVELVNITSSQLVEIKESTVKVTNIAKEVSDSSKEQSRGIEQIINGINQIEDVTQSNSANAEENAAASEELSAQSSKLKELISYFKIDSNKNKLIKD
jgi:methyl-accepting chemotaxis protein